jgi:hypothetical protein
MSRYEVGAQKTTLIRWRWIASSIRSGSKGGDSTVAAPKRRG